MGQELSTDTKPKRPTETVVAEEDDEVTPGPKDRPLPEEPLDSKLLAAFYCPFQNSLTVPYCKNDSLCNFSHKTQPTEKQELARPIPWYICMDWLVNRCEQSQLSRINQELVRCENGLHPSADDLTNVKQFVAQMARAVLAGKSFGEMEPPKCAQCKQIISQDTVCGLLENCPHRICEQCVKSWRENQSISSWLQNFKCPTCAIVAPRILLWPTPFCSTVYKEHLFSKQMEGFGLQVDPQTSFAICQDSFNSNECIFAFDGRQFAGQVVQSNYNRGMRPGVRGKTRGAPRGAPRGTARGFKTRGHP